MYSESICSTEGLDCWASNTNESANIKDGVRGKCHPSVAQRAENNSYKSEEKRGKRRRKCVARSKLPQFAESVPSAAPLACMVTSLRIGSTRDSQSSGCTRREWAGTASSGSVQLLAPRTSPEVPRRSAEVLARPQGADMGELYSALKEDLPTRLAKAERVGYGFVLPREVVPNVPRKGLFVVIRKTPATGA
jgi:hypothetical protein